MSDPDQRCVSIPLSEEALSDWLKVTLSVGAMASVLAVGAWMGWVPTSFVIGSLLAGVGFIVFGQYSTKPRQRTLEMADGRLRLGEEHSYPVESIYALEVCKNRDGVAVLKVEAQDRVTQRFVGASEADRLIAALIEENAAIEVRRSP